MIKYVLGLMKESHCFLIFDLFYVQAVVFSIVDGVGCHDVGNIVLIELQSATAY